MVYTFNQREDINAGMNDYGNKITFWNSGLLTLGYCWDTTYNQGISLTYSDTLGNLIWKKNIYHQTSSILQGNDIISLNNYSFYLTGITYSDSVNQYDGFLAKFDSNGDSIFYKYYSDIGTNWPTQLYQKSTDSLFILTNWKTNYNDVYNKYSIWAIDTTGNNIDTVFQSPTTLKQADQILKKGARYYIGGTTRTSASSSFNSKVFIDVLNLNFNPLTTWNPSTTLNERFEKIFEWNNKLYFSSEVSVSVPTSANDYWQVRIKQIDEPSGITLNSLDIGPPNLFWTVSSNPVLIDNTKFAIINNNEIQNYCFIIDSSLTPICISNLWANYVSYSGYWAPGSITLTPGKKIAGTGYVSSFLGYTLDHWLYITENIETFYIDSCSNFLEINESNNRLSSFIMYPNPANDVVHLEYQLPENISQSTVNVYNYAGMLLKSFTIYGNTGKTTQNVAELSNGFYIFNIISSNTIIARQKIVIDK